MRSGKKILLSSSFLLPSTNFPTHQSPESSSYASTKIWSFSFLFVISGVLSVSFIYLFRSYIFHEHDFYMFSRDGCQGLHLLVLSKASSGLYQASKGSLLVLILWERFKTTPKYYPTAIRSDGPLMVQFNKTDSNYSVSNSG